MWFWWFMLLCDLIIPVIMIFAGRMMWKHCPKKINTVYGYRTKRSMKNMDTWKFAHEYAGRLWWRVGWFILIPSVIVHFPIYGASEQTIGIVCGTLEAAQCLALAASIYPTEKALKRKFELN